MLHVRHLPDFGGQLRASDSELLLQYLLVPYLRVPLLMRFFADPTHTGALACVELQEATLRERQNTCFLTFRERQNNCVFGGFSVDFCI